MNTQQVVTSAQGANAELIVYIKQLSKNVGINKNCTICPPRLIRFLNKGTNEMIVAISSVYIEVSIYDSKLNIKTDDYICRIIRMEELPTKVLVWVVKTLESWLKQRDAWRERQKQNKKKKKA